jgi:nuclear RNA export factor
LNSQVGRLVDKSKNYKIGDDGSTSTLDANRKLFIPSQSHCKLSNIEQNVFELIVSFLKSYFTCFDTNRNDLLAAYHSNATFSLSLNVNSKAAHNSKFGSFFKGSRNLKYLTTAQRHFEFLHCGNIDIVAFLSKLPTTEHDHESFKLDTFLIMPNMIGFSIVGIFKEKSVNDSKSHYTNRTFQRTFICIPTDDGKMSIVNEQFTLVSLSFNQIKNINKNRTKSLNENEMVTDSNSRTNNEIPSTSSASSLSSTLPMNNLNQEREILINRFSLASNLNMKWSRDCLEFANWDYLTAEKTFIEHKNEIPKDAFLS